MPKESGRRRGGKFFAVGRRTWGRICDLTDINQASTYLVLAQGTDRENRHTSWSTTSRKKYAGVSWDRGKLAIEELIRKGFIMRAEGSTTAKPRYELYPYAQIGRAAFDAAKATLTYTDRQLVNKIRTGNATSITRKHANRDRLRDLQARGIIARQADGRYAAVDVLPANDPSELIWLPNTLVTGTDSGEDPPIRRLRSAGDPWALRLLIELYHAHNLRDDGGISPGVLRQRYGRTRVGEQGVFTVWGFRQENYHLSFDTVLQAHQLRSKATEEHAIWDTIENLRNHGLLSFVPHLWDSEWAEGTRGEIIHCYGIEDSGEELEIDMGSAAHRAALSMVPDFKIKKVLCEGFSHFAPVRRTLPNVPMIGVARLRYRPHTARTSDWYGDLARNAPGWVRHYKELLETAKQTVAKSA